MGRIVVTDGGEREVSDAAQLVDAPLVSVLMLAYAHEGYLDEAIEAVAAQICDFGVELIIGEDASPDRTREIALAAQARHPALVRVVVSDANVGVDRNFQRILARARGRYVALCEGDDYWCDATKLARQVAVIEADADIGGVHTDWVRLHRTDDGWRLASSSTHEGMPVERLQGDLFRTFFDGRILRTCTVLYRRELVEALYRSELGAKTYRFGDTVLAAFVTSQSKIGYVPSVTAVYRESPNSALRSGRLAAIRFRQSALEFDTQARRHFATRPDYPRNYRLEMSAALVLYALRAGQFGAVASALADVARHYGPLELVRALRDSWRLRRRIDARR